MTDRQVEAIKPGAQVTLGSLAARVRSRSSTQDPSVDPVHLGPQLGTTLRHEGEAACELCPENGCIMVGSEESFYPRRSHGDAHADRVSKGAPRRCDRRGGRRSERGGAGSGYPIARGGPALADRRTALRRMQGPRRLHGRRLGRTPASRSLLRSARRLPRDVARLHRIHGRVPQAELRWRHVSAVADAGRRAELLRERRPLRGTTLRHGLQRPERRRSEGERARQRVPWLPDEARSASALTVTSEIDSAEL
jgi:hypothetical protein